MLLYARFGPVAANYLKSLKKIVRKLSFIKKLYKMTDKLDDGYFCNYYKNNQAIVWKLFIFFISLQM